MPRTGIGAQTLFDGPRARVVTRRFTQRLPPPTKDGGSQIGHAVFGTDVEWAHSHAVVGRAR